MSRGALKIFQLKSSILSALMTSLDGKNLRTCICPNPGNSKPSISITFYFAMFRFCLLQTLGAPLWSHLNHFLLCHSSQFCCPGNWPIFVSVPSRPILSQIIFAYITTAIPLATNSKTTFTFLPHSMFLTFILYICCALASIK